MWTFIFISTTICVIIFIKYILKQNERKQKEDFIHQYRFPRQLYLSLVGTYGADNANEVLNRLRCYFVSLHTSRKLISSVPCDECEFALQKFITMTREYRYFCAEAFGIFLDYEQGNRGQQSKMLLSGPTLTITSNGDHANGDAEFSESGDSGCGDIGGGDGGGGGGGGGGGE